MNIARTNGAATQPSFSTASVTITRFLPVRRMTGVPSTPDSLGIIAPLPFGLLGMLILLVTVPVGVTAVTKWVIFR